MAVYPQLNIAMLDPEECTGIQFWNGKSGSYGSVHPGEYGGRKVIYAMRLAFKFCLKHCVVGFQIDSSRYQSTRMAPRRGKFVFPTISH